MKNKHAVIIDWGSTNMRAWLVNKDFAEIATCESKSGVTQITSSDVIPIIEEMVTGWQHYFPGEVIDVVMSGMIGSERGYQFVPYCACPVKLSEIIPDNCLYENKLFRLWIIPGVSIRNSETINVMRGEETQLMGAYYQNKANFYLMPGTHSKWVQMSGETIVDFRTAMTGELFSLLMNHSLVGKGLPPQEENADIFTKGLHQGFTQKNIINSLFEIRASYVLAELAKPWVGEYLSGILIGSEISRFLEIYPTAQQEKIVIVAEPGLAQRYSQALTLAKVSHSSVSGNQAFKCGMRSLFNEIAA